MADATGAGRIPGVGMTPDSRPNIILILVDDMGFAVLGIMGSEIPPPISMARRGAGKARVASLVREYDGWAKAAGVEDWNKQSPKLLPLWQMDGAHG